ncbi:hypothetical protein [Paenibacillus alvei]|nr:hypothetical protein [Paenibacillus alvei]
MALASSPNQLSLLRTCREPRRAANAAVARLVAPNPAIHFPYRIKDSNR